MYQSPVLFSQGSLSAVTFLSVFLLLLLCVQIFLLPTHLHAHKSFCLLCKEDFTWNGSSKVSPYLSGLVCCPVKKLGTHVLFLSRTPSRSNFLTSDLPLSVYCPHDWHVSLCIYSQVTDLATWARRQGASLEPPKHRHLIPGLLLLLKGKENICDFTPLRLSCLICRMRTIISSTLCACGEG